MIGERRSTFADSRDFDSPRAFTLSDIVGYRTLGEDSDCLA
jgi:hypothetical protein